MILQYFLYSESEKESEFLFGTTAETSKNSFSQLYWTQRDCSVFQHLIVDPSLLHNVHTLVSHQLIFILGFV
jgi:hypothetical protein